MRQEFEGRARLQGQEATGDWVSLGYYAPDPRGDWHGALARAKRKAENIFPEPVFIHIRRKGA